MKKIICIIFLTQAILFAQNWAPKYSVNCNLDLGIHGYHDTTNNNPWKIADTLFNKDNNTAACFGMTIKESPKDTLYEGISCKKVMSNGATFYISGSKITAIQTICTPTVGTPRKLLEISFKYSNGNTFNIGSFSTLYYSVGRVFLENTNIAIRINDDGLLMIKPKSSSIAKVHYNIFFYPSYIANSPKIPHRGSTASGVTLLNGNNKDDVSHLFIDEYGGFGVYLLDNEKEFYNGTSTFPQVEYSIQASKIFWTAIFPPKKYNYDNVYNSSGIPKKAAVSPLAGHNTGWKEYPPEDTIGRPTLLNWTDDMTNPMSTPFFVSKNSPNALRDALDNPIYNNIKNGYLIQHGDMAIWKDWQFEYVPRAVWSSTEPLKILDTIKYNANFWGVKFIVYTSPQYFIKNAHYNNNSATSPYSSHVFGEPAYSESARDPYYTATMMSGGSAVSSYLINNGQMIDFGDGLLRQLPILNNYDMINWYDTTTTTIAVDLFMKASIIHPLGFTPANREGENMWDYFSAIKSLHGHVDGIFMDTYYEFNIPRTYQLMREIRTDNDTKDYVIFRHASAKEGGDAYLPQIDALADFVITGEFNNNNDYYDRKYWRYFVSTLNISNSTAILWDPKISNIGSQTDFFNWLYDYNIRLIYPITRNDYMGDMNLYNLDTLVSNFWASFPTKSQLETRVNNNLSCYQPLIQTEYNTAYWSYKTTFSGSISDLVSKGDVNGDKMDDLIIRNGNTFYFYSRNISINSNSFTIGNSTDKSFVIDYNNDGKSDIVLYNSTSINVYYSECTSNSFLFSSTPSVNISITLDLSAKIFFGRFTNDKYVDLLTYKNHIWNVYRGWITGFDSLFTYDWGNLNDTPLVGDFNGDNIDDIAIYRTSAGYGEWFVSTSNGTSFSNSPYWYKRWGNNSGDDPLIGKFDGNKYLDIMIHRRTAYPNWYYCLSNYAKLTTPTFYDPSPWWADSLGLLGDNIYKPIVIDFDGNGIDDLCLYNFNDNINDNITIKFIKQGKIRSSETGTLPKNNNEGKDDLIPREFSLTQNYPNPFNPTTTINYSLPTNQNVKLEVYDILGKRVTTLINEMKSAGYHSVNFNASNLSSGIYIYRIQAGNFINTKKMLIMR